MYQYFVSFPNGSDNNIFRQVKVKSKPRTKMATPSAPSVNRGVYESMCEGVYVCACTCECVYFTIRKLCKVHCNIDCHCVFHYLHNINICGNTDVV